MSDKLSGAVKQWVIWTGKNYVHFAISKAKLHRIKHSDYFTQHISADGGKSQKKEKKN